MKENSKIEDLKKNYDDIKIPDILDDVVNDALNINKNKKSNISKWTTTVAACLGVLVIGVNLSPAFADTLDDIPVIGTVIKIINFRNYTVKKGNIDISIDIPKIIGLKDEEVEFKLNKEFEKEGKKLYQEYLNEIKNLGTDGKKYGKSWYEVINENDEILSLVIYNETVEGSSYTTRKFYNINKKDGTVLTLQGMFGDKDYVKVISENIKEQMRERMKENPDDVYWIDDDEIDDFQEISKDQDFYINKNNDLVICFDKYEVAPGSSGLVEFTIPKEIVKKLMN